MKKENIKIKIISQKSYLEEDGLIRTVSNQQNNLIFKTDVKAYLACLIQISLFNQKMLASYARMSSRLLLGVASEGRAH